LWSAIGTKLIATLFAIFGVLMTPIGFWYAILIWGYCFAWFLINDYVKVRCYRMLEL